MKTFLIILLPLVALIAFSTGVYLGHKSGYKHAKEQFEFDRIETQEQPLHYNNEFVDVYDSIYNKQLNY